MSQRNERDFLKRSSDYEAESTAKKMKLEQDHAAAILPTFVQPTLSFAMDRTLSYPDDHEVSKRIDKTIMDLMIVDMLPYSVVEGDAFKRINFADPAGPRRYNVKSEKFYRTTLMPATYDKVAGQ
jgi:hypothetical protein